MEEKKILSVHCILMELKRIFPLIAKLYFPDICELCAAYKYILKLENVMASTDLQLLSHFTSLVNKSPFKKLKLLTF